ncbi:Cmx/CmrA family chloramphenicol efflux MFS transporter [Streptomyces sp. 3MP-14]|uniref:Cmx/CmrA family chloramphenicol efflux MFS transporter n=1 Tax=Streptomyces mimosae TaxID=2586635 RepID=A0A5N5ZXH9_9ACTN|nr:MULTISPECIES: Cmx/CmrA family chloramphenicol efflux MFS transporter [Streptomyces]KAB8161237.1 Cmx/CmrA family chloramphenicol efflux MFS transporter [Streptomyces mimosae]KAB8179267.1 Cmx/CmrA family chloramphenicol efflux MFS transporter [Streptomyces sp. 3MP-14]
MPPAVYLLGLAVFAQGTSEFMLAGLVPDIAADLAVSVSAAGSLTSAFALGMVVGAPTMALLGARWSRRAALMGFLGLFLLTHVVGALTTGYPVLLACRVVGALANAGFLAVALATSAALAGPNARARATAVLLGGVTLACVVGVPGGALLGQLWGWRAAFWAVALLSLPALLAVPRSVPAGAPEPAPGDAGAAGGAEARVGAGARGELRALRRPATLLVLALAALVNAATFGTFTYLAPLATEVAGLAEGWVPGVLALFGLGSFAGVTLAGRVADARPLPLLVGGGAALLLGWLALAAGAGAPGALLGLVLLQGALSFAVGTTLIALVLSTASGAPRLAGGFATAALNVGAALGPWACGLALDAGWGHRAPVWLSAALVAAALTVGALGREALRAATPRRGARGRDPEGRAPVG